MSTSIVRDLYAETTARIVSALEQGAPPWVRPWSQDIDSMPMNAASRRPYRGINALLLALEASSQGYPLNRWLTYRQAAELGGQVRKGEHGTTVLWRLRRVSATADVFPEPDIPDLHERIIPLLRAFSVFNVAQIDGVPASMQAVEPHNWEPDARAEELLLMSGATIRHGGSRAFFRPGDDEIHLPPPRTFSDAGRYYADRAARADALYLACVAVQPAAGATVRRRRLCGRGADRGDGGSVPVRPLPDRR